jgi:hypothetical protein
MAIYSTFFVARATELPGAFPGWKLPLPQPVTRQYFNRFLGEEVTTTSRSPDWDDVDPDSLEMPEYQVVAIEEDYATYLENRIPSFVRAQPHWCAKNLTNIEIEALGEAALDAEVSLDSAMYAHPALGAGLLQLPDNFVAELKELKSPVAIEKLAAAWAARMSTPEHTHTMSGERIEEDWTAEDARRILDPLLKLVQEVSAGQAIYLLIEA